MMGEACTACSDVRHMVRDGIIAGREGLRLRVRGVRVAGFGLGVGVWGWDAECGSARDGRLCWGSRRRCAASAPRVAAPDAPGWGSGFGARGWRMQSAGAARAQGPRTAAASPSLPLSLSPSLPLSLFFALSLSRVRCSTERHELQRAKRTCTRRTSPMQTECSPLCTQCAVHMHTVCSPHAHRCAARSHNACGLQSGKPTEAENQQKVSPNNKGLGRRV